MGFANKVGHVTKKMTANAAKARKNPIPPGAMNNIKAPGPENEKSKVVGEAQVFSVDHNSKTASAAKAMAGIEEFRKAYNVNGKMNPSIDKLLKDLSKLNQSNTLSPPSIDRRLAAQSNDKVASELEKNKGLGTYENLKRHRSQRFMGTDPVETEKLVQELLLKRQLQETVAANPKIIPTLPKSVQNSEQMQYLNRLASASEELQRQGAVPLTKENAMLYGLQSYGGQMFPGAHIIVPGSDLDRQIREQGRLEFQKRQAMAAEGTTQFPVKLFLFGGSLILGSYIMTVMWDVYVEMHGEPPFTLKHLLK